MLRCHNGEDGRGYGVCGGWGLGWSWRVRVWLAEEINGGKGLEMVAEPWEQQHWDGLCTEKLI